MAPRLKAKEQGQNMHLSDEGLIVILVVGFIAGWLAGKVVRGNGFGLVGDAAIGIVGALIGDWLLHRLGVHSFDHRSASKVDSPVETGAGEAFAAATS